MPSEKRRSLDQRIAQQDNLTYRAKPTLVDISEKYDLPKHGTDHVPFDDIKNILLKSHEFSESDIAQFKKSNDVRYFLADLDTGDFSKERVNEIIQRYKNNPDFRKEFRSLLDS